MLRRLVGEPLPPPHLRCAPPRSSAGAGLSLVPLFPFFLSSSSFVLSARVPADPYLQVGGGVAAVVGRGSVQGAVRAAMVEGMANYGRQGFQGVTATWDTVQADLRCCGVEVGGGPSGHLAPRAPATGRL